MDCLYFAKLTANYTPKNRLKKYLAERVSTLEKMDVADPAQVVQFLERHIGLANKSYRNCTPVTLTQRVLRSSQDIVLSVVCLFDITLYKKHGSFTQQTNHARPIESTAPQAADRFSGFSNYTSNPSARFE